MTKTSIALVTAAFFAPPMAYAATLPACPPKSFQLAEMAAAEHCTALEQQFVREQEGHKSAKEMEKAKKHYEEGMQLCKQDRHKEGIEKLTRGLELIGVKPTK